MSNEHLAWHETLEIHELVAFQSNGLMKLKKALAEIENQDLIKLYKTAIEGITSNLMELLQFYPDMPREETNGENWTEAREERRSPGFHAGDLLGLAKTSVRNYAIAITETATPEVRQVLKKHLNNGVDLHARVFHYMEKNGLYPAYDLEKLLTGDVQLARKALKE
ncbi:spore coat protein F [Evansella caseinilytica]|uniref:Spore coat protein F n=1 Tax=Evansella caseinilytica TaxID=1503961 RepID=A0A1H3QCE3_9BACI|nr:spore coat protein [Evansella caseinilytica]SDZ10950.1 spore coat protein F [Evansella caseinilytica]